MIEQEGLIFPEGYEPTAEKPPCDWCGKRPTKPYEVEPAGIRGGRYRPPLTANACAAHIKSFEHQRDNPRPITRKDMVKKVS